MSLRPEPIGSVPEETARLVKAVFPEGSTFIKMRDELGVLFQDEMFAPLFPMSTPAQSWVMHVFGESVSEEAARGLFVEHFKLDTSIAYYRFLDHSPKTCMSQLYTVVHNRRHDLAGSAGLWPAAESLSRNAENPFAAPGECHGDQPRKNARLDGR